MDHTGKQNASVVHGRSFTPEHRSWTQLIQRCTNPNNPAYAKYGGRGITVCARWRNSFVDFLADMGERPSLGHSLDRIDNDAGYFKENCRWATKSEQACNRRSNRLLTLGAETLPVMEWSRRTGLKRSTIEQRLVYGWSVERALTTPVLSKPAHD